MKVRGSARPERYSLEISGGKALLYFYDNVTEINEDTNADRNGFSGWEYDRYKLILPYDSGLKARVESDVDLWLTKAKAGEKITLAESVRKRRNELLAATDYTRIDDFPISTELRSAYKEYRQLLRDIPEQIGFPYAVIFPEEPTVADLESVA